MSAFAITDVARKTTGSFPLLKIAVKVINHYGDEVLKIYAV